MASCQRLAAYATEEWAERQWDGSRQARIDGLLSQSDYLGPGWRLRAADGLCLESTTRP